MKEESRIPKTEESLENAFHSCEKKGKFRKIDSSSYSDYLQRAQKDLASAERDFQSEDFHWARIKAYQSLFHILNALLIKKLGYFSKDHGCVIVALMKKKIITSETALKINLLADKVIKEVTSEKVYKDIDEYRIQRNFAMYRPKAWEEVKKADIEEELKKIKENFKILAELL